MITGDTTGLDPVSFGVKIDIYPSGKVAIELVEVDEALTSPKDIAMILRDCADIIEKTPAMRGGKITH